EGLKSSELSAGEKILFDITNAILNPAFFIGFAHGTGDRLEAVVPGKVQITRVKSGFLSQWVREHAGFQIIDHDSFGHAAKEGESVLVATEELLHPLAQSKLQVKETAVTKHHDKEGQAPP